MAFDKSVLFLCVTVLYFILLTNGVFARPRAFKEGDIRLIGGREDHIGTVLVYHDRKWGAVCDNRWDINDAFVACYQLGYSGAERAVVGSEFGRGRRRMWLSRIACEGYEERLDHCRSSGYGVDVCRGSYHSAGVICTVLTTTVPTTQTTETTTTAATPWNVENQTWLLKQHIEPTTVELENNNERYEPNDIVGNILNDDAAVPPEDTNYAEYTAPETLVYNIPNEIEIQHSEAQYPDANEPIPALTSPRPTTQTPWMWDDTLSQYIIRPGYGRRIESPWVWNHELQQYVLRSEYESHSLVEQPPLASVNVPSVEDRQHDYAYVRDPLEMLAHVQADATVPEAGGIYDVPFIPEVANPEEYLHGDAIVETDQANSEHHVHDHEQHGDAQEAIPLQPVEQNTHYESYQIENSQEATHAQRAGLNENPLFPTHGYPHTSTDQLYNSPLPVEDPNRTKMIFRVEGGRSHQEGRIEIRPPYQDSWGVICGDMWTLREAIVACREFGIGFAQSASKTSLYGGADKNKLFWRVKCVGNEQKLEDCSWEDHNGAVTCSRRDSIAGIVCRNDLPDLIPNVTALETSSFLQDRHLYYLQCSMEENCLSASAYEIMKTPNWMTTTRRLLRFSSIIHNRGNADFVPFIPRHLWEWHACHMHYHSMEVFARYDIVDEHGNRVAEGLKASFCLEDSACDYGVHPKYNCDGYGHQGIAVGCSDNYLADIDCQWIDMTDVKPGTYTFKLEVNPELRVAEMNFENNVVSCTLWYGGYNARLQGCHLESLL